jgi:hypothetical protein
MNTFNSYNKKIGKRLEKQMVILNKQMQSIYDRYLLLLRGQFKMELDSCTLTMQVWFKEKPIVNYGLKVTFTFTPINNDGETVEHEFKIKTQSQFEAVKNQVEFNILNNQLNIFNLFYNYENELNKKNQNERISLMNRIVDKIKSYSII